MKENKKLTIFCSWDGSFFREQAKLLQDEYDVQIIIFYALSIKQIFKTKKNVIIEELSKDENIRITKFSYIDPWFLPYNIYLKYQKFIAKKLYKNAIQPKTSLIHAQTALGAAIWANQIYENYKTPFFLTEHQQFILNHIPKNSIYQLQNVFKNAKKILVVSNDKARQMLVNKYQFDFEVVGNYVNEEIFNCENKSQHENFVITSIGAFSYLKDSETIFKLLGILDKQNNKKKIEFNYVGFNAWGKDNIPEIERLIVKYDIKNITINLYPKASRFEVAKILKASSVFLLTSISEGLNVSMLEALASGVPVISTQCGGSDEVITPKNGLIVMIRDVDAILNHLNLMIKNTIKYDSTDISKNCIATFGSKAFKNRIIKHINTIK